MNDLHKPLGQSKNKGGAQENTWANKFANRDWLMPAVGVGCVCLLSYAAYVVFDSKPADKVVVALGDAKVAPTVSKNKKQPAGETREPKALDLDENGEIDLSKIKPLTPLDPLDQNGDPAATKQAFKPKPAPRNSRSAWVPLPDLVERSEFGRLPKISSGGIRPLDAYSQSSGMVGANRIALIVGGLGISQTGTQSAIAELPSEVTLGFSPFGNSLQRWMQRARREGHEVVLQLPMEPLGYPTIDPGPHTLTSRASRGENLKNLRWSLGRMTNYPLVMNYLGAGLSNKPAVLRPILEEIRNRGLGFIDDGSVQASSAPQMSKDIRLPHAVGAMTVDSNREEARILASLRNLEALARQKGFAIGVATAFPGTVDIIKTWAKDAQKRGILIVPASNLIKDYTP